MYDDDELAKVADYFGRDPVALLLIEEIRRLQRSEAIYCQDCTAESAKAIYCQACGGQML